MIHDFVKKSLDLVHDGGQVAIISSTGTMDKRTENILQDIRRQLNFLVGFDCLILPLRPLQERVSQRICYSSRNT